MSRARRRRSRTSPTGSWSWLPAVPALHHRRHVAPAGDGVPVGRGRLTAALTTLLSAFVGFGVLTLVVQQGYLFGLTGLDMTGPIETFVPPIAFAILFGLSMDYWCSS